ncbi:MAG: DMT family transporter [Gaiellaceae bacterium]
MVAIALALGAAVSYGVGDFLGGLSTRRAHVLTVLALSQLVGAAAVAVWAAAAGEGFLGGRAALAAMGAGLCGAVGLAGLYRGMASGAMAVVAPISSIAAAIPFGVGVAQGERPSTWQVLGAVAALCGLAIVSRSPGRLGGGIAAGVGLALLAAAGFGLYFVLLDVAAHDSVPWGVLVARLTSSALALTAVVVVGVRVLPARQLVPAIIAVGICDTAANVLFALATTRGLVSVVSVLTSLYPAITVGLAALVLRERVARVQLGGAAAVLAGAAAIAAG